MTGLLVPIGTALALLVACVVFHAVMLSTLVRWYRAALNAGGLETLAGAWLLVRVAWWTVLAHLIEMTAWAVAYVGVGAIPSLGQAAYFSAVTYTTVGYGDVTLPPGWQVLAGIEGLTGILMAGWSTAFLFTVLNRMLTYGRWMDQMGGRDPE